MQKVRWMAKDESASEFLQALVRALFGIVLLAVAVGIWVCLWVPPMPSLPIP